MIVVLLVLAASQIKDNAPLRGGLPAPNGEDPLTSRSQPRERRGLPPPTRNDDASIHHPDAKRRRIDPSSRRETTTPRFNHPVVVHDAPRHPYATAPRDHAPNLQIERPNGARRYAGHDLDAQSGATFGAADALTLQVRSGRPKPVI
jgi:hypothetical protein